MANGNEEAEGDTEENSSKKRKVCITKAIVSKILIIFFS